MTDVTLPGASALPGLNILLEGPSGTGKTHSIGTLVDLGLHVHYFAYEAGTESLLGYYRDRNLPVPANLHVCTVKPASASWSEMADQAGNVTRLSYEMLKKQADVNRAKYDQFEKFLRTFNEVTEDGTKEKFGSVDSWGTDHVVVIDGLTGLGDSAMKAVIGGKYDRDQKDWGLAQNMVENFLRRMTSDCTCHFILLAHVERETDPIVGGTKIMVSTLGAKLAPKIPAMFSDVILSVRNGAEFYWDTINPLADLKTRNLPLSAKLPPSFAPIFDRWQQRGGVIGPKIKT